MKLCELEKRVKHVCEYIIGGIEREQLCAKYNELQAARARAVVLEVERNKTLEKYE